LIDALSALTAVPGPREPDAHARHADTDAQPDRYADTESHVAPADGDRDRPTGADQNINPDPHADRHGVANAHANRIGGRRHPATGAG
jgi:hypothetical protein